MSATLRRLLRIGRALGLDPTMLVDDAAAAARRLMVLLACAIMAIAVLVSAVGCAAAGLWIAVQYHLGPAWAAFITAAALALVALTLLIIGLMAARGGRRERAPGSRSGTGDAVAELLGAAAAGAALGRGFFTRLKIAFLLAVAVAGLVMGQDLFRGRPARSRRGSK